MIHLLDSFETTLQTQNANRFDSRISTRNKIKTYHKHITEMSLSRFDLITLERVSLCLTGFNDYIF
jgi:hypothetical protein